MLQVIMTEAKYGDCILLRCGELEKKLNILIDSGQRRLDLSKILCRVKEHSEGIDYMVLTHDDDDHVNGLCSLVNYVREKKVSRDESEKVNEFLNGLSEERILFNFGGNGTEQLLSAKKIDRLSKNLLDDFDFHSIGYLYSDEEPEEDIPYPNMIQIKWEYDGDKVVSEINPKPTQNDLNTEKEHLELVILTPTKKMLKRYIEKAWVTLKQEDRPLSSQEKCHLNEWDYSIQYWIEHEMDLGNDNREANNASISFLLLYNGNCALFAGDAPPDDMVSAGKEYLKRSCFELDYMSLNFIKLPHHGSSRNINKEFFDFFRTENYLISTSGHRRNQHPGKGTLAQIANRLKTGEVAHIYGNYEWWKECFNFYKKEDCWEEKGDFCHLVNKKGAKCFLRFYHLSSVPIRIEKDIYLSI